MKTLQHDRASRLVQFHDRLDALHCGCRCHGATWRPGPADTMMTSAELILLGTHIIPVGVLRAIMCYLSRCQLRQAQSYVYAVISGGCPSLDRPRSYVYAVISGSCLDFRLPLITSGQSQLID